MSNSYPRKKLLFCVTKMREEERRIYDYLLQAGIEVDVCTDSMQLELENIRRYDVALIRCLSQSKALERAQYIELAGVKTLNSYEAIKICTNKAFQAIIFKQNQIAQPDFAIAFTFEKLYEYLERFDGRFVIKPVSSSWGRGVTLINSKFALDAWISARESLDPQGKALPVLVQEYVDKGNYDIRVVIVDRKPIVAFKRVSNDNWLTNTHLGAEIDVIKVSQPIQEISKQLIDAIGEGIYGLDLFYDHTRNIYMVCEVNQNPEFAKSWLIHKVDVAKAIAESCLNVQPEWIHVKSSV
ncbi:ATP-grasp domain-containing protein [Paenibacillus kyungheensis]